jgi:murein DD-endopeptidase MepM/ murein hydrolase activator NlpD
MISQARRAAAIVSSLLWMSASVANSQERRPLQVSLFPAAIRPGDVVRLEIRNADANEALSASVLGQTLNLEYDDARRRWLAWFGVDLETKPGEYSLHVNRADSAPAIMHTVRVTKRQFRVRRLKVSPRFVDPPPETLEQIARDSKMLADTYARMSPKHWTGAFVLPVDGKPSSNFGTRSFYNGEPRAPHAGVDFASGTGTPIRAANYGTVALAAPLYFTGNTIVIDHGARLFSVFAHLSELMATEGDQVQPQTIVGRVGSTGRVTGPHLHWSVRLNGARVDPLSLIAATSTAATGR